MLSLVHSLVALFCLVPFFAPFSLAQQLEPSFDGSLNNVNFQPYVEPEEPQFLAQKARLREIIQRPEVYNNETWSEEHPRYHLLWALHGFYRYRERHMKTVDDWLELYDNVPEEHKKIIQAKTKYQDTFSIVRSLFNINSDLAENILKYGMAYYDIPWDEVQWFIDAVELNEQWDNQFRSEEAMQHYMRDWSTDGQHERDVPYRHIIAELEKHFPERLSRKEGNVKVLVPGSGLGRLAHEISRLEGVEVTACEYSPQMRLAYRYLESLRMPESGVVYPYIDFWSHQPTTKELIHPTKFPDVSINSSAVLLVEGDFTKEFVNKTAHYDALVTFFFIDTAKNAMDYLNTISKVLKPDGVWINLGPLLYSEAWVEFSLEDLLTIAEAYGFEFLDVGDEWGPLTLENKKARGRQIGYLFNERSLRRNTYMAQLWAARKKK